MSDFLPEPNYDEDPATITVEIAGVERPWYLGAQSFEIAREKHGVEPGDIMSDSIAENGQVAQGIEAVVNLVWVGFLVFDPTLERSDVKQILSFPPSEGLMGPINKHMTRLQDEEMGELVGNEAGAIADA